MHFQFYEEHKRQNTYARVSFLKKRTLAQVFSCEFCKIFKNTFFTEHFWATVSARQTSTMESFYQKHSS